MSQGAIDGGDAWAPAKPRPDEAVIRGDQGIERSLATAPGRSCYERLDVGAVAVELRPPI